VIYRRFLVHRESNYANFFEGTPVLTPYNSSSK
jgi:hypothetical protein